MRDKLFQKCRGRRRVYTENTEHTPNRDDVSAAILQHLDGLRGIDTHCHHLPDDQFQNMGVKFYTIKAIATGWMISWDFCIAIPMSMQISAGNGRMARLWHTAILAKWNPIFEYIPIEAKLKNSRMIIMMRLQNAM